MKKRTSRQKNGDLGEIEITKKAPCPNCGKKLILLPLNSPLYDVQCEGCFFRAQIKTSLRSPHSTILGGGWDILHKVLKTGYAAPPLIVNFKCKVGKRTEPTILFFPFITKNHTEHYKLGKNHPQKGYPMFEYVKIIKLPHFRLNIPRKLWETGTPEDGEKSNRKIARMQK
jgi:hypothetical protein